MTCSIHGATGDPPCFVCQLNEIELLRAANKRLTSKLDLYIAAERSACEEVERLRAALARVENELVEGGNVDELRAWVQSVMSVPSEGEGTNG